MDEINKSDEENNVSSDDVNQLNQNNNELDNTNANANTEPVIGDVDVTKQEEQQQQQTPSPPTLPAVEAVAEQSNEQNSSDALAIDHNAGGDGGDIGDTSVDEQKENSSSTVTKCDEDIHPTSDAPKEEMAAVDSSVSEVTEMEHEPIEQPVISTQDEPPPDPPDEPMQNKPEPELETQAEAQTQVADESVAPAADAAVVDAVASPPKPTASEPQPPHDSVNDENIKSVEHPPSNNDHANNHESVDDTHNDNNQMSQIDNSEDLLVPTDYVPDSADVIGDDSKRRRHSQSDEASEEPFKKFKHDTACDDEDVSMAESVDDLNDMCTENEVNDQPPMAAMAAAAAAAAEEAAAAAAAEAVAAATATEMSATASETSEKIAIDSKEEQPLSSSTPPPPMPSKEPTVQDCETETATTNDDELNIADIFSSKEKTFSLVDIIDNADDLISKENEPSEPSEPSELNCDDSLQKASNLSSEPCSDDVVDNAPVATVTDAVESDPASALETDKKLTPSSEADLNFDISEKLKEMGEISVAPVSKSATNERKPSLADFDLGDEISLEQIKKSSTAGDSDDKRNKVTNLRKNIREVMDDNQLDASTLAAQREELERLARVQEQQRMIREMQRQVALDRQNSKTQNKVLSLLTGHTSLLKSSAAASTSTSSSTAAATATGADEMGGVSSGSDVEDILAGKSSNLTPSVSIAPIKPSQKKSSETSDAAPDMASKSIEPCEIDLDADEKFNQLDKSDDNDLMIVDEDSEEEDEDDDDVVELKAKRDIVEIEDSSDDDCIM